MPLRILILLILALATIAALAVAPVAAQLSANAATTAAPAAPLPPNNNAVEDNAARQRAEAAAKFEQIKQQMLQEAEANRQQMVQKFAVQAGPNNLPGGAVQIQINQQVAGGGGAVFIQQQGGGQATAIINLSGGSPITLVNGQPVPAETASATASSAPTPAVPAVPIDQRELPALVAALGGENWAARQGAEDQLTAAGPDILARLDPFLAKAADPEALWRLERIYRALTPPDRYVATGPPAYLGIGFSMVSSGIDSRLSGRNWGVQLVLVQPGSPADQAGLAVNDLIVSINGEPFVGSFTDGASNQGITERIQSYGIGAEVKIVFFRGQERREATVKLAPRTDGFVQPVPPAQKWKRYWTKHLADLRAAEAPTPASPAGPKK